MAKRRQEVTAVVGHHDGRTRGSRDFGDVRVIDAAAASVVSRGRSHHRQTIGLGEVVYRHPGENLFFE